MHTPFAIRDPIHGYIRLTTAEMRGIDTVEVQRLRGISQLGLTERVYPGARHSRFEHALGSLEVISRILADIRGRHGLEALLAPLGLPPRTKEFERLLCVSRWAALLHDLGHAPFSHVSEDLLPDGAHHEEVTHRLVEEGAVGEVLRREGESLRDDVLQALRPPREGEALPGPLSFVRELLSGPVGADRMDYLLRDSAATGVSYGIFDLDRVLHTLVPVAGATGRGVRLGIQQGGVLAVEGMLWARISMFRQVYFHRTRRILDRHLVDFLRAALPQGHYPSELREYTEWGDARVWELLRSSAGDPAAPGHADARRILHRRHHRILPQELESSDGERIAGWLEEWRSSILRVEPRALPLADRVLPPPESESGSDLPVAREVGGEVPLREVSSLVGHLRQRPIGRMYVSRDCGEVPDFPLPPRDPRS